MLLPFDKLKILLSTIKFHGGIIQSLNVFWHMDTLKEGKCMGTDCLGNQYYENNRFFFARNRWVVYNPTTHFNYDASQVHPMWFGWLHYKTDRIPCEDEAKHELCNSHLARQWLTPHLEIMTGTPMAYYPYSTTRPAILPWNGGTVKNKSPKK